jgi:hypothetical protein
LAAFEVIIEVHDEYAVSQHGMKAFGVLDLATEMEGCRFSIGLLNSHDKSMRLAMTRGYRVFVCSNMAFAGDFTPVLAKHSNEAFVEGRLEAPKHLARTVHDLYFEPKYEGFRPRTIWSLFKAFTSVFKELEPIPQFKATAKLGEFLEDRLAQSFY